MTISWQELLKEDREVVLFSADVDRIQDYVFESARLPEIRGASMLVEKLVNIAARYLGQRIIYKGGGSLLAIFPDRETAKGMKAKIECLFPKRTGVATITCVIREIPVAALRGGYMASEAVPNYLWGLRHPERHSDWERITRLYGQAISVKKEEFIQAVQNKSQQEQPFGQMVELMSILLRREKDQRSPIPLHEALPQAQRCRSCGQRPAVLVGQYADTEESWPLCDPCWRKIKDRQDKRSYWLDQAIRFFKEQTAYFNGISEVRIEQADDLTDIGLACQARQGYIAFIYADGDSIGRYMASQRSPEDYAAASEKLKQATAQAVYKSLAQFLRPTPVKRKGADESVLIHPFEIITIGGDDALLLVPADLALPIAVTISRLFSQQLPELTMSVGVVIASDHTPVRWLRDMAKQLLKSAKRRAREVKTTTDKVGGLDFLVLTSQSMLRRTIDDWRNTYPMLLPGEAMSARLRLTGAPYTLTETQTLLGLLDQMRQVEFPTTQLQQLTAALQQGREQGSLYFLYQQARMGGKRYGSVFEAIAKKWKFSPKTDPIPWQTVEQDPNDPDPGPRYTSILPDLLALYSFVPDQPEALQRWSVVLQEVAHANSD
ncbi:MAG: hypothetical protein AB1801_00160 [Chloroflexota bacterium]